MKKTLFACLLTAVLAASPVLALINPSLQPLDLADRYKAIVFLRVDETDERSLTASLSVEGVSKGEFVPKTVSLVMADNSLANAIISLRYGQTIVAYVGKEMRNREKDVLYYVGNGVWFIATMGDSPAKWTILGNADKGKDSSSSQVMFGTFNGAAETLWTMMKDTAKGVSYYPAVPFSRFSSQPIGRLDKAVQGVAVHDLNGDGRLDLFACSAAGNRLFLQDDKGGYNDGTAAAGLATTRSASCSVADVDADGDADLLLDGVLFKQSEGVFAKSGDVPSHGPCLSAAFMEYNGDGYPDVVVSRVDDGLSLYQNPGPDGGAFEDWTEDAGLTDEGNGEGQTGYFEVCDWDVDGRTDLIFVAGPAYLLWHNASGMFEAAEISENEKGFDGGTAAFGAIVRPDLPSLYLVANEAKGLVCEEYVGTMTDVMANGNEIQDPASGLLMAVAEDLNADGTVDLFAASRLQGTACFYVANRGYASFLLPEKYRGGKIIPPAIFNQAIRGIASGDVNGDGAVDLLLGTEKGTVVLLLNKVLEDRPAKADVSTTHDHRKQIQTRIVTVHPPAGKGQLGCRLSVVDSEGSPVAFRWNGINVGVGCSSSPSIIVALREPGQYTLRLRLGDGTELEQALTINDKTPRHQSLKIH